MAEATLVIEGFPVEVIWSRTSRSRKALSLERSEKSLIRTSGPYDHRVYGVVRLGDSDALRRLLVSSYENQTYLEVLLPTDCSVTIKNHFKVEYLDAIARQPLQDDEELFIHLQSSCKWELL